MSNAHINHAILCATKLDAVMYACSEAFANKPVDSWDPETINRAVGAFYATWDIVIDLRRDLQIASAYPAN